MAEPKTRERYTDNISELFTRYSTLPDSPGITTEGNELIRFRNWQRITSSGHRHHLLGKTKEDIGGEFRSRKWEFKSTGYKRDTRGDGYPSELGQAFNGTIHAYLPTDEEYVRDNLIMEPSEDSAIYAAGTILVSRALPTNPAVNVARTLGELIKDGIPNIPFLDLLRNRTRSAMRRSKSAADEYLNIQFGWAPLIKDLRDFATAVRNINALIEQYRGNAGKNVRRKRRLRGPETTSTDEYVSGSGNQYQPAPPPSNVVQEPRCVVTLAEETNYLFSGCFVYGLPPDHFDSGQLQRYDALAARILGLRLTPELLWQLAPWSWAVDWFVNVGAIIRNVTAFNNDNLVMRYGYITEVKTRRITVSMLDGILVSGPVPDITSTLTCTTVTRLRATPYGFGLNPSSFGAFQWSIIAALGISKIPGSLSRG
jgi:hypothetical protein